MFLLLLQILDYSDFPPITSNPLPPLMVHTQSRNLIKSTIIYTSQCPLWSSMFKQSLISVTMIWLNASVTMYLGSNDFSLLAGAPLYRNRTLPVLPTTTTVLSLRSETQTSPLLLSVINSELSPFLKISLRVLSLLISCLMCCPW